MGLPFCHNISVRVRLRRRGCCRRPCRRSRRRCPAQPPGGSRCNSDQRQRPPHHQAGIPLRHRPGLVPAARTASGIVPYPPQLQGDLFRQPGFFFHLLYPLNNYHYLFQIVMFYHLISVISKSIYTNSYKKNRFYSCRTTKKTSPNVLPGWSFYAID